MGEVTNIRIGPVLSLTALAMLLTFPSPGLPPGEGGGGGGGHGGGGGCGKGGGYAAPCRCVCGTAYNLATARCTVTPHCYSPISGLGRWGWKEGEGGVE